MIIHMNDDETNSLQWESEDRLLDCMLLSNILKHLRQFVQSDWFLPVFISHDKDTACDARIDPFERRGLFSYLK